MGKFKWGDLVWRDIHPIQGRRHLNVDQYYGMKSILHIKDLLKLSILEDPTTLSEGSFERRYSVGFVYTNNIPIGTRKYTFEFKFPVNNNSTSKIGLFAMDKYTNELLNFLELSIPPIKKFDFLVSLIKGFKIKLKYFDSSMSILIPSRFINFKGNNILQYSFDEYGLPKIYLNGRLIKTIMSCVDNYINQIKLNPYLSIDMDAYRINNFNMGESLSLIRFNYE